MPTPDLLGFESLLGPISEETPTGVNLREDISPDSLYYRVKDARAAARATERAASQADDPKTAPVADWRPVLELAPKITAETAKDLEIVAWWIEALARAEGFAGLRDGFRLVTGLVQSFWDELHPMPDEDGISTRVAPLAGLNGEEGEGTLIAPIGMIPITSGEDEFGLWHYNLSRELSRLTDEAVRAEREAANGVSQERFQTAVSTSSPEFFQALVEDVEQCIDAYREMCAALDEKAADDAPPTSAIRNALDEVRQALTYLTKDVLVPVSPPADASASDGDSATASDAPAPRPAAQPGELRTRADAINTLRTVARFFRDTEPHSPVPYLIDQAVRWSQTALPELVKELIPDEDALGRFHLMTGIKGQPPEEDED